MRYTNYKKLLHRPSASKSRDFFDVHVSGSIALFSNERDDDDDTTHLASRQAERDIRIVSQSVSQSWRGRMRKSTRRCNRSWDWRIYPRIPRIATRSSAFRPNSWIKRRNRCKGRMEEGPVGRARPRTPREPSRRSRARRRRWQVRWFPTR